MSAATLQDAAPHDDGRIAAGELSDWLPEVQRAIRGEGATDVPCGCCVGCCSSSQFILIGPEEREALAHIPEALLFPAPRMPRGHVLMGYDEHGRCPMLINSRCTIYEHRPRTCRTYDCRVFTAAGVAPEEADKPLIAAQVRRWRFSHATAASEGQHDAVRAAAAFLTVNAAELGEDVAPRTATQLAVAAVETHALFLGDEPVTVAAVRVVLTRH